MISPTQKPQRDELLARDIKSHARDQLARAFFFLASLPGLPQRPTRPKDQRMIWVNSNYFTRLGEAPHKQFTLRGGFGRVSSKKSPRMLRDQRLLRLLSALRTQSLMQHLGNFTWRIVKLFARPIRTCDADGFPPKRYPTFLGGSTLKWSKPEKFVQSRNSGSEYSSGNQCQVARQT